MVKLATLDLISHNMQRSYTAYAISYHDTKLQKVLVNRLVTED